MFATDAATTAASAIGGNAGPNPRTAHRADQRDVSKYVHRSRSISRWHRSPGH
jgi:hypothetical protein